MELSVFPFLTPQEFCNLCHSFIEQQSQLIRLGLDIRHRWSLFSQDGEPYLYLRKKLQIGASMSPEASALHSTYPSTEVSEDEEEATEDPESLPPRPASSVQNAVEIEYNILYSPIYRLPVLYFTPLRPLSSAQLYALFFSSKKEEKWDGTVTQGENLRNGEAWWFVHPCRTGEAMEEWRDVLLGEEKVREKESERPREVANGTKEEERLSRGKQYLGIWLGIVGGAAGLW